MFTQLWLCTDSSLIEDWNLELFRKTFFAFLEKSILSKTSNPKIFARIQDEKFKRKGCFLLLKNQVPFNNWPCKTSSPRSEWYWNLKVLKKFWRKKHSRSGFLFWLFSHFLWKNAQNQRAKVIFHFFEIFFSQVENLIWAFFEWLTRQWRKKQNLLLKVTNKSADLCNCIQSLWQTSQVAFEAHGIWQKSTKVWDSKL